MTLRQPLAIASLLFGLLLANSLAAAADDADQPDQPPKPVQVFILAGQSNMAGFGVVSMDDPRDYNGGKGNLVWSMQHSASKDQMQHLRNPDGTWAQRSDVDIWYKHNNNIRKGPLTVGYTAFGKQSHIGPELQFGHVIGDAIDAPVMLIKTAWGGKSLHKDFRPPSATGDTGPYYTQMISEVREALQTLEGRPYQIVGFVWQQGWNDMISTDATAEYADNLALLANDIRTEFQLPRLPMIVGELGNGGPAKPDSGMYLFRAAQRLGTENIAHAVFVETAEFARPAKLSPNTGHGHHWYGNAESYFLVGEALGRAAVKMLKQE